MSAATGNYVSVHIHRKVHTVTKHDAGGYMCPVDFTKTNNVVAGTYSACAYMSRIKDGKFIEPPGLQPIKLS